MKKTIIKTAVITALLLLCSVFIIYFATYIVSPGTIGDMYKNLGMKNNAVEMYEKQYLSKGNAFDDLKELVDMAIYAEDEERQQQLPYPVGFCQPTFHLFSFFGVSRRPEQRNRKIGGTLVQTVSVISTASK